MRIGLGSDHRGVELKKDLVAALMRLGHRPVDYGPVTTDSCDYPDYAEAVARAVALRQVARGVLICSTGIGMTITANKVKGVRAALCLSETMAERASAHNKANVCVLGADLVPRARARRIVKRWLATPFEGGRHARRLAKIRRLERRTGRGRSEKA